MKYISSRSNEERISFKDAVLNGLSNNGGLYLPEVIPVLPEHFFENITEFSNQEIAFEVLKGYVGNSLTDDQLRKIVAETISFEIPLLPVEKNVFVLELFHGPTQAFKDVGARFMSRCLQSFRRKNEEEVTVLVATSGDTGGAVANGFHNVEGVKVKILFPKNKVSRFQEFQMTSLGGNVDAIEVEGTFDDCQKLVKEAFSDSEVKENVILSSANSINVARLLPQMLFYFFAHKQLKARFGNEEFRIAVPSGNLGNITSGLIAKKMGLPIKELVAGLNENDTFLNYLKRGVFEPKPSVETYANAMDVGDPSNFERIVFLYKGDVEALKDDVSAYRYSDEMILKEMEVCYQQNQYLLDPHGAIGKMSLAEKSNEKIKAVFLATAHPRKFSDVIQKVLPEYPEKMVNLEQCTKKPIKNEYLALKKLIME